MSVGKIILVVLGILVILASIDNAGKHGKSKGKYNARFEVLEALLGVFFILVGVEVL